MKDYIEKNYSKYLEYSKNIKGTSAEDPYDVLNECILYMLEFPKKKQTKLLKGGYTDWYMIKMITYSYQSKSSKYQQKYNRLSLDKEYEIKEMEDIIEEDEDYDNVRLKFINYILQEKCNWYEREVFTQYITKFKSFRDFQDNTGISYVSLFQTYTKVKKTIIENLYLLSEEYKK